MDCDEFVELATAFLEGALPDADEARFVGHLSACDGCEAYFAQLRRTVDALGAAPVTADTLSETLSDEARGKLLGAFRDWNDPGRL